MKAITGKTQGLKASQIKKLERLSQRRVGIRDVLSPELARSLTDVSADTSSMVGLLIDRKGAVTDVIFGEPTRLYLPDVGRHRAGLGRLRGLRLVVALPTRRPQPSRRPLEVPHDLVTDLERLKLDAVLLVEATSDGGPGRVALATLLPDPEYLPGGGERRHQVDDYSRIHDVQLDFDAFIKALEAELGRKEDRRKEAERVEGERDVAVLVGAYTVPRHVSDPSMAELMELARTAGVRVVDVVTQRRSKLDPRTIVGKGKLEEICLGALHRGADLLIFDLDLSPSQLNAITDLTDLRVLDRTMLILDIFARRATSKGGRMQVELAQAKYSFPRLAKKQTGLSRLTGGIGGQGPGETKLEVDRRRVKEKIARLERDIDRLGRERQLRRQRRNDRAVPTLALVGYTNAGKSTLLNALTGADVYAKDQLFATLDPTSRRLRFPTEREVILVDTVGFIRDLPETLVNAFRATLEELHDADLLLNVVDVGDPRRDKHIEAVDKVLDDLGLTHVPRLLVFNKADAVDPEQAAAVAERKDGLAVSALTKQGFEALLNRCADILWQEDTLAEHETWAQEPVGAAASDAAEDEPTELAQAG
jgi:GTP-binding protein HflX